MSDWVKRAVEAYQAEVDKHNAYVAKVRTENKAMLASTVSWLIGEQIDPGEAYFVEPDSYRLKVEHPEHTVLFTLIGDDKIIGVIHTCPQCGGEYTTITRNPAELGSVLANGQPKHEGCRLNSE